MKNMRKRVKAAIRSNAMRWTTLLLAQALMFGLSGVAAFMLRFDFSFPPIAIRQMIYALAIWIVIKSLAFQVASLNRRGLRYVSIADVYRLLLANLFGAVASCVVILAI